MATRNGSAEWRGDLQFGSGDLIVGDGVFEGAYSFASRFEEGEGTTPRSSSPPPTPRALPWP